MEKPCFKKLGSDPPVCGIHEVPLRETSSSQELSTMGLRDFAFYKCPVSGQAIDDPTR
jgi:hypothetical protein